jgi:outer membrane protein
MRGVRSKRRTSPNAGAPSPLGVRVRRRSGVFQLPPQQPMRAVQARLHVRFRGTHHVGGLPGRQPFDFTQQDDLAVPLGQRGECLAQPPAERRIQRGRFGTTRRIHDVDRLHRPVGSRQRLVERQHAGRLSRRTAPLHQACVANGPIEPRAERRGIADPVDVSERVEQSVLHHVLRVAGAAADGTAKPVRHVLDRADQPFEGVRIPLRRAADECRISVDVGHRLRDGPIAVPPLGLEKRRHQMRHICIYPCEMQIRGAGLLAAILLVTPPTGAGAAQVPLTLDEAVAAALAQGPDVTTARAAEAEARERIPQARAGFLPRVDVAEIWQRGNQPIFVFGSLLAQRQFTEAHFALNRLNHPDSLANFRTAVSLEQVLFDGGRTHAAARVASLGFAAARAGTRRTANDTVLAVTEAYGRALLAAANGRAAQAAVTAAREDARVAMDRRDAGFATDADVLALQVHLSEMRQRDIAAASDERLAYAALNRLLGAPLDREVALQEPPSTTVALRTGTEQRALAHRPELDQARLQRDVARAMHRAEVAAFLPHVSFQGALEWNGRQFADRASAWTFGASIRWNLFAGGADAARRRETARAVDRAEAERASLESAIRLEARTAEERLAAAGAREEVGRAMVVQARESQRIIRDRFEAGLASTTDVLRAARALLDAEAQRIGAVVDVIVGRAALRHATGSEATP